MTKAHQHFTTKDGHRVIVPSRRERREHWRKTRAEFREPGVKPRQKATDEWRASWQPLRGNL